MINVTAYDAHLLEARIIPENNGCQASAILSFHDGDRFPGLRMYFSDPAELRRIGEAMIEQAAKLEQEQAK